MIRHLLYELRIAIHPAIWMLPISLAILRLISRSSLERFLGFFEFVYSLLFPIVAIALLGREKRWHTFEVLVATPHAKTPIFLSRLLAVVAPLFCAIVATVRSGDWLIVLAPSILLAMVALLVGLVWKEEVGLTVALGWWGISFAIGIAQMDLLQHPLANWALLFLLGAGLTPEALLLRKAVHLAVGALLFLVCIAIAEGWFGRFSRARFRSG